MEMVDLESVQKIEITTLAEDCAAHSTELWAQHGLSLLVKVFSQDNCKRILFDVGHSAAPIFHNAKLLEKQLDSIDCIFLSHCHYDHTKGLVDVLRKLDTEEVPIVAHPDLFRPCFVRNPERQIGMVGENTRENIRESGGILRLSAEPFEIFPGVVSTGEIERTTDFEEEITLDSYTRVDGKLVGDRIQDDMGLVVNVEDHGLVLISGCSHSGIVNIVKHSEKFVENEKVRTVIGGFHLLDAGEKRIERTVKGLVNRGVEEIYPGHCTGFEGEAAIKEEFGDNFERLNCGKIIDIPSS